MRYSSFRDLAGAGAMLACLAGCQLLGPVSIDQGRGRYSNVIQDTTKEQTLANIVRVYNHEPTLFLDVTEVDAVASAGGSITGATTNIGAVGGKKSTAGTISGQVGSFGGTLQYSETPTIRYQPLLGQPLVAQLVTPVSVEGLGLLYDSYWGVSPLLDFSSAYLTLDLTEFYPALNTIAELYDDGVLELAATKSELAKAKEEKPNSSTANTPSGSVTLQMNQKAPTSSAADSLTIYLLPFHAAADLQARRRDLQLWVRLLRIYDGTQPRFPPVAGCAPVLSGDDLKNWEARIGAGNDATGLDQARTCLPSSIELRTVPVTHDQAAQNGLVSMAPTMRTYSALGILKNATERPLPKIEFVSPGVYGQIRAQPWNQNIETASFYTLLPEQEDSFNCPDERKQKGGCDNPARAADKTLAPDLKAWLTERGESGRVFVYDKAGEDALGEEYIARNRQLGLLRRYILVVVTPDRAPDSAYVAVDDHGLTYYIAGDDVVSQKNFHLLSLFMTMMAIPSLLPPLSPVINVGG
jgi:hypothetical protein